MSSDANPAAAQPHGGRRPSRESSGHRSAVAGEKFLSQPGHNQSHAGLLDNAADAATVRPSSNRGSGVANRERPKPPNSHQAHAQQEQEETLRSPPLNWSGETQASLQSGRASSPAETLRSLARSGKIDPNDERFAWASKFMNVSLDKPLFLEGAEETPQDNLDELLDQ